MTDLHQMVDSAPEGIMVKGPGGIGKSHSLVNLVRRLTYRCKRKYRVTVIPDCSDVVDVAYTPSSAAVASACFA